MVPDVPRTSATDRARLAPLRMYSPCADMRHHPHRPIDSRCEWFDMRCGRARPLLIAFCIAGGNVSLAAAPATVQYSTAPIAQIEVGGHSEEVRSVSVSPDGQLLLTTSV